MSEWISAKDNLPETSESQPMSKIVFGTTGPNTVGLFRYHRGAWAYVPPIKAWPAPEVTHWMPLPEPPK
jgi:hypothetical protein